MGGDEAGEVSGGQVTEDLFCHVGNYEFMFQRCDLQMVFHGNQWFYGYTELLPELVVEVGEIQES